MKKLLLLIAPLLFMAHMCKTTPPSVDVKIYAADSATQSIQRSQDNEIIYTNSSEFDNYMCMTYEDYKKLVETYLNNCKAWDKDIERYSKQLKQCGLDDKVSDCLTN